MQNSKTKRILFAATAAVLAATQCVSALPALAVESDTDYIYGTVNLPYADYYYGELCDVAEDATMQLDAADPTASIRAEGYCDAVTSATNTKSVKYGCTYYTANEDGSVTVSGIQDVAIAVPKSLYDDATAALEAGESCSNQLLSIISSMTVNEEQDVVPTEYKVLNGDGTLTAMVDANEAITVTDAKVEVTTNTKYGNYQLSITGADDYLPDSDNMEGAVLTMSDGSTYAMLHVDNLWLRTGEMAWAVQDDYLVHNVNVLKYKSFEDTIGKTVTSVRYIIRDGADVTIETEAYLPVLHDGTVSAENAAVTDGAIDLTLTDLPEDFDTVVSVSSLDVSYADGVLTYDAATAQPGSYTITVTDGQGVYAPFSTSVLLTTEDLPAAYDVETNAIVAAEDAADTDFANYLSKIDTVTVNGTAYSASGKGATKIINNETGAIDLTASSKDSAVFDGDGTYEVTVSATGYTTELSFVLTVGGEAVDSDTDYIYGTVNLPYADYYYGELCDVAEDATMQLDAADPTASIRAEGYCDAVTSATNTKSVKYGCTYYTANEDGSVTVSGIQDVAIAVPKSLYEDATAALEAGESCSNQLLSIISSMTVNEEQDVVPTEYKILNGDGTLTAMVDANEAITVTDAKVEVTTNTKYGNYQLSITGADDYLPDSDNMEGAVLTMSDGSTYAMLHVDNLWLRTGEMAWAVQDDYLVHNVNVLKYKSFEDTIGKTVTSVRYIIRDGADVTIETEAYLPVLHDGTVSAENAAVTDGAIDLTLTDLPEDFDTVVSVSSLDVSYADGVLTYDAATAQPGSYAITVTDGQGVYAPFSTSVLLTTEDLPAAYDAETNAIVAAEDAADTDFANYLSKIATVTVNGTAYSASGKGATKIINSETGAIDLTASSKDSAVFDGDGTYEVTVSATGYTTELSFVLTVGGEAVDKGDINQDGVISADDAYEILVFYANHSIGNDSYGFTEDAALEAALEAAADVNGDGVIDTNDAYYVLLYYAQAAVGDTPTWEEIIPA